MVIAAIRLLPERSVDEIVAKLTPAELEQVIKIVERSPGGLGPGRRRPSKNTNTGGRRRSRPQAPRPMCGPVSAQRALSGLSACVASTSADVWGGPTLRSPKAPLSTLRTSKKPGHFPEHVPKLLDAA